MRNRLLLALSLSPFAVAERSRTGWFHSTSTTLQDAALSAVEAVGDTGGLAEWFRSHRQDRPGITQRYVEKTNFFLPIYHRHLKALKARGNVRFLELGVQSGGSQQMFLDYFGATAHAYGADLEPRILDYPNSGGAYGNITNFVGDLGNPKFLASLCRSIPRIDFILDDASHMAWHQILAFELLYPCLSPHGGVYMIEDLAEGPCHPEQGRIDGRPCDEPNELIRYMQRRAGEMILNCSSQQGKRGYSNCYPTNGWQMSTDSVHFYSGIIALQKVPYPRSPSWQADGQHATRIEAGATYVKKRFKPAPKAKNQHGMREEEAAALRQKLFGASAHGVEKPGWWRPKPKER
jgi:SAM-dependent methyltransferase